MTRFPIVHHPDYQAPLRKDHRFPMSKYGYLRERLIEGGLIAPGEWLAPAPLSEAAIARAHDPGYVARAFQGGLTEEETRRIGLPQTERVLRRSRLACAGTLLAARLAPETGVALNAAGGSHHAGPQGGSGYCVFNDVAIAILALLREDPARRFLVLDCDVHQGDGTAAIFRDDPRVFTLSLHGEKNFPFRKQQGDLDIGLPDGTGDAAYLNAMGAALSRVEAVGKFDLAFYNAGVDPHEDDRLGRLSLTDAGLRARDALALSWARAHDLPIVGVMGGGYGADPSAIAARHAILFEEAARSGAS